MVERPLRMGERVRLRMGERVRLRMGERVRPLTPKIHKRS